MSTARIHRIASSRINTTWRVGIALLLAVAAPALADEPAPKPPAPVPESPGKQVSPFDALAKGATERSTDKLIRKILGSPTGALASRKRYLDLMKLSLTDLLYENDPETRMKRIEGWDWPGRAYTMTGLRRLANLESCFERVLSNKVPGDLIEAGAWRGGATIYMRALLAAYDVRDRTVWVADSFEGMPVPDAARYPADEKMDLSDVEELAVSLQEVKRNFRRYGLLDDQVRFLKGWFKDSLPGAPIKQLAILRLDADLYESTMDAIKHLYPKLSPGGCLIVDDYWIPACEQAITDYRSEHGITDEIVRIDTQGVFWIKR
jgi:hypothetical protein